LGAGIHKPYLFIEIESEMSIDTISDVPNQVSTDRSNAIVVFHRASVMRSMIQAAKDSHNCARMIVWQHANQTECETTEWRIGQPLDFPQAHSAPLREAVNESMRGQVGSKRQRQKKK